MKAQLPVARQSRLGVTAQKMLCIEQLSPLAPGEKITATFPDEVLVEVFAYLSPKDYFSHRSEYEDCLPLTLVCKRWRRVYEPLLYRRIDLGYSGWKKARRVRQLLSNLEDRAELRGHAKAIGIQLSNANQNTCNNIARIVAHCKATRSITLHTDLTDGASPLLDAMAGLPCLESLGLSGYSSGPSIYMILQHFAVPCLKSLELSRYGIGKGTDLSAPWPRDFSATQHDLEQLLPPDRYHTGNVTSMVLSDPSTPFLVSEHVLRWPARLESLSITWLTHSTYSREYNLTHIERLLCMHSPSLKRVKIGIIPGTYRGMPDFSSFQSLEELHLSTYSLLFETPSNVQRKLAAPCLRHLSMSFSTEDQHSESHKEFAMEQVHWMADFAKLKTTDYPASRLETIHVDFNPECIEFWWEPFDQDVTWPWQRLDEAGKTLAQHGLSLTYSKPRWSKQEWDELVQEQKEAAATRVVESTGETGDPGPSAGT